MIYRCLRFHNRDDCLLRTQAFITAKLQNARDLFHIEQQSVLRHFLFRSYTGTGLYSAHLFICPHDAHHVHRRESGDYTISSGAGGPNTMRSLCRQGMDHRMAELARFRTRFLLILITARTNRWNLLVIDIL